MNEWYFPRGGSSRDGWDTVIDNTTPGWQHTGLRIGTLGGGAALTLPAADVERIVLPLSGSFRVEVSTSSSGDDRWAADLAGRADVWSGPTDLAYTGPHTQTTITGSGRFAVASAHAVTPRPPTYLPAASVPIELRGTGTMSREVRNFGTPDALEATSIIACEVLTPAGNWSSYPPHKHDQELEGIETKLEEIYYFELRTSPGGAPAPARSAPIGYQRVSASDDRTIDVLAEIHDGDVVLIPFGWHGPSMAAPGYDMYYLNVMAGPGRERAWRITDHPDQTWLRTLWPLHEVDPRLPFVESAGCPSTGSGTVRRNQHQ